MKLYQPPARLGGKSRATQTWPVTHETRVRVRPQIELWGREHIPSIQQQSAHRPRFPSCSQLCFSICWLERSSEYYRILFNHIPSAAKIRNLVTIKKQILKIVAYIFLSCEITCPYRATSWDRYEIQMGCIFKTLLIFRIHKELQPKAEPA